METDLQWQAYIKYITSDPLVCLHRQPVNMFVLNPAFATILQAQTDRKLMGMEQGRRGALKGQFSKGGHPRWVW